jgi:hypothetical protein
MKIILNMISILCFILIINCFPNGQSPRDECKNGDVYNSGKRSNRDQGCTAYLLTLNSRNFNQDGSNLILIHCLLMQQNLEKCDNETTLPIGIGSVK